MMLSKEKKMASGKEQMKGTVRKTCCKDEEAKFLTANHFLQILGRSKLVPPRTIQTTGHLKN